MKTIWVILGCSIVVGTASSLIPWGTSDGFHGTGFPFFSVAWEKRPTGFVDFPNPLAFILNPIVYFVLGLFVWFLIWAGRKLVKR
jgi:hypothetical protein